MMGAQMSVSSVLTGLYGALSDKLNDAVALACQGTTVPAFRACREIGRGLPDESEFYVPATLTQLAVWGFSLHHEAAKGCLNSLNRVEKFSNSLSLLESIVAVRHYLCHNDLHARTVRCAQIWFLQCCGSLEPTDNDSYLACNQAMYKTLQGILTKANEAANVTFKDKATGRHNARLFTLAVIQATQGREMAKRFTDECHL